MKTSKWSNDLSQLSQVASLLKLTDSVLKRSIAHSQAQGCTDHLNEHQAQLAEVQKSFEQINDELQTMSLLHEAAILTGNYRES